MDVLHVNFLQRKNEDFFSSSLQICIHETIFHNSSQIIGSGKNIEM